MIKAYLIIWTKDEFKDMSRDQINTISLYVSIYCEASQQLNNGVDVLFLVFLACEQPIVNAV